MLYIITYDISFYNSDDFDRFYTDSHDLLLGQFHLTISGLLPAN